MRFRLFCCYISASRTRLTRLSSPMHRTAIWIAQPSKAGHRQNDNAAADARHMHMRCQRACIGRPREPPPQAPKPGSFGGDRAWGMGCTWLVVTNLVCAAMFFHPLLSLATWECSKSHTKTFQLSTLQYGEVEPGRGHSLVAFRRRKSLFTALGPAGEWLLRNHDD